MPMGAILSLQRGEGNGQSDINSLACWGKVDIRLLERLLEQWSLDLLLQQSRAGPSGTIRTPFGREPIFIP